MSDNENYEITSQKGKELLKQIEDELSRIKSRNQDGYGDREYEPNEILAGKVRELVVNLQLSVCYHTTTIHLQLLSLSSTSDIQCGGYRIL